MSNEVKIKLTDAQKEKIREATGKDMPEIRVENFGSNPALSPSNPTATKHVSAMSRHSMRKIASPKRTAKIAARHMAKKTAPRLVSAKRAPKVVSAKRAPRVVSAKRAPRVVNARRAPRRTSSSAKKQF